MKKRNEPISISEKKEIVIREKEKSFQKVSFSKSIKTFIAISSIIVFIFSLVFFLKPSSSSQDWATLPNVEKTVDKNTKLHNLIYDHTIIDKNKASSISELPNIPISAGAKVIKYFHLIEDPYPFFIKIYADHQTLYTLNLEQQNYQLEKTTYEKEIVLKTNKWLLVDDMLNIITRDSIETPFKRQELWQIENILSWSIGLRNLRKNDVITWVTEQHFFPLDDHIEEIGISGLALQSQSLDTTLHAIKFSPSGRASQYYDYSARPWKRQFLSSPVKYGRISSRYNLTRMHPKLKKIKAHRGTDFAAPQGVEIYALAGGAIIEMEKKTGNGNYVKLKHDDVYTTAYLHMHKFNDSLKVGDKVKQGQLIGFVGSTGLSTGPHVCLRFWRSGHQDDFLSAFPYLPAPAPLPYKERKAFEKKRDKIVALTSKAQLTES